MAETSFKFTARLVPSTTKRKPRVGVLLLNLGGPERIQDVKPFLYNLFSDPEIIRLPVSAMQKPFAWLISSLRSGKSRKAYRSIGGGSPLRRITEQQARERQSSLRQHGVDATSYVAMRYWHPVARASGNYSACAILILPSVASQSAAFVAGTTTLAISKRWPV